MLFDQAVYEYVEAKSEGRRKVRPNIPSGFIYGQLLNTAQAAIGKDGSVRVKSSTGTITMASGSVAFIIA